MLKDKIISEAQITSHDYGEDAEVVSLIQSWGPQELFSYEKRFLHHQFYRVILRYLWFQNVTVPLEPPDVR